jgi:hypothetical protein
METYGYNLLKTQLFFIDFKHDFNGIRNNQPEMTLRMDQTKSRFPET